MEIDKEKQAQILFEVARKLDLAEKERADRRFLKGIRELEQRNFAILSNDEFVDKLPQFLHDLHGDHKSAAEILDALAESCCQNDSRVRERALVVLSVFSDYVLENNNQESIRKIAEILMKWLEHETEYLSGFGIICQQLQKIGLSLLGKSSWQEAEQLLALLRKIQVGNLQKSNTIKGMAAKVLENLATKDILENLVSVYIDSSNKYQKSAGDLLKNLGRRSTIFLLNRLMHCENKEERFHLMHLIPETGNAAIEVFEECLKKNPPWYVIRNIILMISERGDTSFFFLVEPYLLHPDIRVQQQVIICIGILGGQMMMKRYLAALPKVHDELKVRLVMKLGLAEGNDVADGLLDLFEKRGSFSPSTADELLLRLCVALKSFPCQRTLKNLQQLIAERKNIAHCSDKVVLVAEEALSVVAPRVRHDAKGEAGVLDELSFDADPLVEYDAKKKIRDLIEEINNISGKGDVSKASEILFSEMVKAAKEKDFKVAELLRDKILKINPMALSKAMEAAEIIEEEKGSTVTGDHLEIWSALYEKMTTEEFSSLYNAMRHQTYSPEEPIVKTGETDPSLYFLNSGLVRLSCMCGNKETFLKRLQPGEILGVGQFFSVSVWTVSLVAQTVAQVNVLERDRFIVLKERHPDLEGKLYDYCMQYDVVPVLLRMTGSDRREYARYPVSVITNNMMLDPYGNKGQRSIKGETIDISRGGLSFSIRISNKENAKLLLGRQIICEVIAGAGNVLKYLGIVVGVKFSEVVDQEFSVHVKFYTPMEQVELMRISKSAS
jgi:hypothetical protein